MAQKQINKQIENLKSSLNKKYEDTDNPVQKIKSALSHLNISEIDIEKLKNAVIKAKNKNLKNIKKLQRQRPSSLYHHHTHPQHRNVSITSSRTNNTNNNNNNNNSYININNKTDEEENNCIKCTEQAKWTWLYCIKLICRYLTYFFVLLTIIAICIIIITKKGKVYNNNETIDTNLKNKRKRADELTGMDTLRLLTQSVGQSVGSMFEMIHKVWNNNDNHNNNNNNDNNAYEYDHNTSKSEAIKYIQSIDSSRIFLKASSDNKIRFIPFKKPLDSWCSRKQFSFQTECINVHNVRDVKFNSKTKELEFLISASYPRLIEINEHSIVILNDRVFRISLDGKTLEEVTNNEYYENGDKYCVDNILFIEGENDDGNDGNRIVISGSCYGLLYLPQSVLNGAELLHLLSTQWSSIIVDSNLYVESLIIASNNEACIIFRSKLITSNLNLAITDSAYVEFKEISEAEYISMISLKSSQIYIPSLIACKIIDCAARNNSLIQIANIIQISDIHLSISHFSSIKIPHIIQTQLLTYKREKGTQLLLPHPYNYIQDNHQLEDILSFV